MAGASETQSRLRTTLRKGLFHPVVPTFDLTPGMVTAIYLLLGFTALYFSDVVLPQNIQDSAILRQQQALKGGVEIVLTAGLIFLLTKRSRLALKRYKSRVEHLQAERSVLHRVFRHNLRQELNLIDGYSTLIRDGDESGDFSGYCDVIEEAADRTEQYVEMTSQFEQMLRSPTKSQTVDLVPMVANDTEVNRLRESHNVELTVDIPDEAKVIGHSYVKSAFHEILENALTHNISTRKRVRITIREGSQGIVELSIRDDGPGIPDIERRAIESMEELPLNHSGGLGLWFAKLACTVTGGDLVIRDSDMGGAEVVLQYPAIQHHSVRRRFASV